MFIKCVGQFSSSFVLFPIGVHPGRNLVDPDDTAVNQADLCDKQRARAGFNGIWGYNL